MDLILEKKIAPVFSKEEKQDIRAYYAIYRKYAATLNEKALDELKNHSVWGTIINQMPGEMIEEQNIKSLKLQENAFFNDKWEPYINDLTEQGIKYAKLGVDFKVWYDVISLVRKYLVPNIIKEFEKEPKKIISSLRGLDLVMDFALGTIGDSYSIKKKKLIEEKEENIRKREIALNDLNKTRQYSQYVRSLIEASIDPLITISADGKITDVNEAFVSVTGVSREKLIGTDFLNYFTEPEKATVGYQQVFEKGFLTDYPLTIKNTNGKLTEVLFNTTLYKDEKGVVKGVFAAARDVTQQKLNERKLREQTISLQKAQELLKLSETKYRKIVEEVGDVVYTTDPKGNFTYFNPIIKKLTGYSEDELIGKNFLEIIDPGWRDKVAQFYKEQFESKAQESVFTFPIITKSGEQKWVEQIVTQQKSDNWIIGHHAIVRDITKSKLDEDEIKRKSKELLKLNADLSDSQQQIETMFNSAPDAVIVIDQNSTIIKWNHKAETLFGWELKEVIGKHIYDFIIPERYRRRHIEGMKHYLATGTGPVLDKDIELEGVNKKGNEFSLLLSISPVDLMNKKLFIGFLRDNTIKKKAEETSKEYEHFFNNSHDLVCIANLKGYFEIVNPNFKKVLGYSEKELTEVPYTNFIHPDDLNSTLQQIEKLKTGEEALNFINRYRKKDGTYVWFDWNSTPDISKGKLYAAARDITERKKIEDELKKSNERFLKIFDSNSIGMVLLNLETNKFQYVNKIFLEKFGYTKEEVIGKTAPEIKIIESESYEKATTLLKQQGYVKGFESLVRKKNGETFWSISSLQTIKINDENFFLSSFYDITEQKKAEEALRNSENFLNSIIENIPTMLFVKDAKDLKFVRFNKAGEDLLGYTKAELFGKNDYDFFPKTEADFFTSNDRKVIESGKLLQIEEETVHTKNKGERILETKKIPIFDSNGNPIYLLGISNDITDLKKLLSELDKKTKDLERSNTELEQFASVASHDLQEPLRTISNFVGLLKEEYSETENEAIQQYFTFITSASSRMQTLIKDLLEFSRVGRNPVFVLVDCNKLLKEIIDEMDASIQESNAKIIYSNLPVVKGMEIELKRLFQNLISNAIKFRKKNVVPEIEITAVEKDTEYLFSVKDNGIGIEEKFIPKLFILFQRLNNSSEYPGTGIGLATAKKIVNLHNGKIWLESKYNEGSIFYFTIQKINSI